MRVNVEGLAPGFYHYSAYDHDLGLIETDRMPKLSELVGGQDWADEMPCLILLCATLGRTMWKYDDPNAYRVVLIEAGHIGQNIMLAATRNGLVGMPDGGAQPLDDPRMLVAEKADRRAGLCADACRSRAPRPAPARIERRP